jgi:hypothetical protein
MNKFEYIVLNNVTVDGLGFEVAGVWNDRPFNVSVFVVCDGREIETESLEVDGYDPSQEDDDFLDTLFSDPRYDRLSEEGLARWELFENDQE